MFPTNRKQNIYEFSVLNSGVSQIHKLPHLYHVNIKENNLLTLYIFTLITLKPRHDLWGHDS